MGEAKRARLEVALAQHYAAQREAADAAAMDDLVTAMVAEDARMRRAQPHKLGTAAFIAAQVRYIPAWTWMAQAALVTAMCTLASVDSSAIVSELAIGLLSALTILVGVPTLQASKLHNVAELEYACPHNAASVLVARLIALGCSSALSVALMVGATAASLDISAFDVALWACPPFFLSCAGSLMALRKASPSTALALSVVWTLGCCAGLVMFVSTMPDLYAHASLAVWAGAAAAAGAWLAREVAMTMRAAVTGLDTFSPHMAMTHN